MNQLNHVRLRGKMLIVYFLSVFLPIVVTNLIFYQVTTHNVRNQKIRDMSLAMEQIRNDFLAQIDSAIGISSVLYTDSVLNEALAKNYPSDVDYVTAYNDGISQTLYKYSPVYKAISSITIYTDNPTIVAGGGVLPIDAEVKASAWYRAIEAAGDDAPIVTRTENPTYNGTEETYSVIRKLDNFSNYGRVMLLKVDIDPSTISGIFHNVTLPGNLYLLNADNQVEYSTDSSLPWRTKPIDFGQVKIPADAIRSTQTYQSISYLRGWRIVGAFPESEVLKEVRKSRNFVLYLAIPNLLIPTLILLWITRSLNYRIIRILKHMKKVKNQHFQTIEHEHYQDEIGQLTEEFNRMTLQIRKLIDEVYIADIQKKDLELKRNEARLHALRSQINPHFLFNALETIRMRSLMKQEKETAKIIQNMAKIFRKSLSWDKDWVSVKEELELILCFLEIQRYRFGDKLDYEIDVDPDAYSCKIPHMSVLPFVENASIHGIEPLKGNGRILVRIRHEEGMLTATVSDNGIGMSAEKRGQLLEELQGEERMGERIGIKNVVYRMKMHYGPQMAFELASEPGTGTTVTLQVPLPETSLIS